MGGDNHPVIDRGSRRLSDVGASQGGQRGDRWVRGWNRLGHRAPGNAAGWNHRGRFQMHQRMKAQKDTSWSEAPKKGEIETPSGAGVADGQRH